MKKWLTPDFFKFLLGFSLLILAGFVILVIVEGSGGVEREAALWYYSA